MPVGKAALSHRFSVLRGAGLVEQRDRGPRRVSRLRREEFDACFSGLLSLVLRPDATGGAGWTEVSGAVRPGLVGVRLMDGSYRG